MQPALCQATNGGKLDGHRQSLRAALGNVKTKLIEEKTLPRYRAGGHPGKGQWIHCTTFCLAN